MRFGVTLSLTHIGPEACARRAPTAVLPIPFSLRSDEIQQFAHPPRSLPYPSAMPRDRLTHTFPHSLSHAHVHETPRRCREKRHSSETASLWSAGVSSWHAVPFRSPRRAHVGAMRASGSIALLGSIQTQLQSIARVMTAQCARGNTRCAGAGTTTESNWLATQVKKSSEDDSDVQESVPRDFFAPVRSAPRRLSNQFLAALAAGIRARALQNFGSLGSLCPCGAFERSLSGGREVLAGSALSLHEIRRARLPHVVVALRG